MKAKDTVGIVGFGNMGSICAETLSFLKSWQVFVYEKKYAKTKQIKTGIKFLTAKEVIEKSQVLILAIKPQDLERFIIESRAFLLRSKPLIISLLAGIPLSSLQGQLPGLRVARAMPNLAAKVKKSVTFLVKGSLTTQKDMQIANKIFSLFGDVIEGKESLANQITALSGSGPGFVYYLMNAFYQQAKKAGFSDKTAKKITIQIFQGSAEFALQEKKTFPQLIKMVASPGGTTEAGISFFEKKQVVKIISDGIAAADKRAQEISKKKERRKK